MNKKAPAKAKLPDAAAIENNCSALEFQKVVSAFSGDEAVTVGANKGFGGGALTVNGKIFAMISSKGEFVVKLSKVECDQIVERSEGHFFDPGHGRTMKEWIVIESGPKTWITLALAARRFAANAK